MYSSVEYSPSGHEPYAPSSQYVETLSAGSSATSLKWSPAPWRSWNDRSKPAAVGVWSSAVPRCHLPTEYVW